MNIKNNLIKWLSNNQGIQANIITARFRDYCKVNNKEIPSAHEVRKATEELIKSNQLVEKKQTIDGKIYKNIFLPEYILKGKKYSIRGLVNSEFNTHNLSLKAIRNRLLKGLSPDIALSLPPLSKNEKWKLKNIQQNIDEINEDLNW